MKRVFLILAALAAWTAAAATPNRAATEAFVTNKIAAAVAALPAPDYSTNNTELVETIQATAPAPDLSTNNTALVETIQATAPVSSVNCKTGAVVLSASDVGALGNTGDQTIVGESSDRPYFKIGFDSPWPWLEFGESVATNRAYSPHGSGTLALLSDISVKSVKLNGTELTPDANGAVNVQATTPDDIPSAVTNVVTKAFVENLGIALNETDPTVPQWAKAQTKPTYTASEVGATTPEDVTAAIREQSLGGIWDEELQVWWTPRMRNGSLTYEATTNVNLNAEN